MTNGERRRNAGIEQDDDNDEAARREALEAELANLRLENERLMREQEESNLKLAKINEEANLELAKIDEERNLEFAKIDEEANLKLAKMNEETNLKLAKIDEIQKKMAKWCRDEEERLQKELKEKIEKFGREEETAATAEQIREAQLEFDFHTDKYDNEIFEKLLKELHELD